MALTRFLITKALPLLYYTNPRKALTKDFPKSMASKCTFINPYSQKSTCQICLSPPTLPSSSSSQSPARNPKWSCKACTFLNSYHNSSCEICETNETRSVTELGTLKILSYNVWFRHVEMPNRMKALGDLIRLHSPDVICLQEVTPHSYGLFQQSNWWKSYKCSLSNDMAVKRAYFCMQLSKLPVKSFSCKPFRYSAMERELCVTEVAVRADVPLVVATSHLESPCPAPPHPTPVGSDV